MQTKAKQSKNWSKNLKSLDTERQTKRAKEIVKKLTILKARSNFQKFVTFTKSDYLVNWHHAILCEKLQLFAEGKIKKLMVFMPPQHGKSELTSRRLPAYLLGLRPTLKIIGCSYSADLSKAFNRDVQRIIDGDEYPLIFPDTTLNSSNVKTSAKGSYLRNADLFEIVNHRGFYKSVGVGGSLTGTPADIGIIDDPVKDKVEAESPTYRARVWDWYTNVFLTRMHNDSQQLITLTRWNKDDLAGRILARMNKKNDWVVLSLPAIKRTPTIPEDMRLIGEALWPAKHSLERILEIEESAPMTFSALYQQDPETSSELKIYPKWRTCKPKEYDKIDLDVCYGIDFGFTNPSAVIELKVDEAGKKLYIRQKVFKSGLTNIALVQRMKDANIGAYKYIGADSNKPDAIVELKKNDIRRFNVRAVKKPPGSVYNGIKKVNEYEIIVCEFVCESSTDVQDELSTYKWKEDADGNPLPEPVKSNDHAMDAIRYGLKNWLKFQSGGVLAFG
jgi:hypothetical protein